MFNQIFVSYLEKKNAVTPEQAKEVLEAQKNTKIRIGTLAVEENLMTPQQVEFVNEMQASKNMRFGDIAVEKGYLTKEQMYALLNKQPKEHLVLKQILNDKQYMQPNQFERDLNNFKFSLGINDKEFDRLLDNDVGAYITYAAGVETSGENFVMNEFFKIFVATSVRLIDREVHVKKSLDPIPGSFQFVAEQNAVGDASFTFSFAAADSGSAKKFAECFAKASFNAFDGDAQDSMKEFLNCICGLLISELSNTGKMELDIEVPEYYDELPIDFETVVLPLSLSIGDFYIFVKNN